MGATWGHPALRWDLFFKGFMIISTFFIFIKTTQKFMGATWGHLALRWDLLFKGFVFTIALPSSFR